MKTRLLSLILAGCVSSLCAQEAGAGRLKEISDAAKSDSSGWTIGGGIGLDMAGIALLNPRVGAGAGRFGLGGLGAVQANYKSDRAYWNSSASLQLSAQRLGRTDATQPRGFQKNLDVLQLNSRYGYKLNSDKWFFATDATARTQLLQTYASGYLKPFDAEDRVVSKFLSPLQVTFSPGIDYKPNPHLSLFYSPAGIQYIHVADDAIAATNIFGNEEGKNYFLGLGSEFKAAYTNKYYKDRFAVTSSLRLFSNYLKEPQNIDVLFANNFSIMIFKGLSIDLLGEYLYDHDVLVQKDVNGDKIYNVVVNADGTTSGDDRLGRGGQLSTAFLLKYSMIF